MIGLRRALKASQYDATQKTARRPGGTGDEAVRHNAYRTAVVAVVLQEFV